MIKRFAQAWGFAAILLLPGYVDLTSTLGDERMRIPWPLTSLVLAQLVDLAIVGLVFAGLLAVLRGLKVWPRIRWFVLAFLPIYLLVCNLRIFPFRVPYTGVAIVAVAWIVLLAFLIFRAPNIASKLYGLSSAVLTGAVVFAVVMTAQLVSAAFWRPGIQAFAGPIPAQPAAKPRLVWIIFDELAYKPVFEARDHSLDLPNFDRLRLQSTIYSNVTPIGYHTNLVVPSLLLGRVVTALPLPQKINSSFAPLTILIGNLLTRPHRCSAWRGSAVSRLRSSVGTWLTARSLWVQPPSAIGATTTLKTAPLRQSMPVSLLMSGSPCASRPNNSVAPRVAIADVAHWESLSHVATVKDMSQHALTALANSHADIIYLHLPVPHPPAFWDSPLT
jgi:hypothetical protein